MANLPRIKKGLDAILFPDSARILQINDGITTGATRDSVHSTISGKGYAFNYRLLAGEGWHWIDNGRKKGKMPLTSNYGLPKNLNKWKKFVGFTGSNYALARSINSKDRPPKFITRQLINYSEDRVKATILKEIAKEVTDYVIEKQNQLFNGER